MICSALWNLFTPRLDRVKAIEAIVKIRDSSSHVANVTADMAGEHRELSEHSKTKLLSYKNTNGSDGNCSSCRYCETDHKKCKMCFQLTLQNLDQSL